MKVSALLNNKKIDGAKPADKPYKLSDSHGLYISIQPGGAKSWRIDYKQDGKNKTKTFGQYPNIGVAEARLLSQQFKISLLKGSVSKTPTFDEFKKDWLAHKLPTLKNIKHKQQVINRMQEHASPILGNMPLDTIKRADLVKVVHGVQSKNIIETSHRVGMHIRQLFDYAVDMGILESHPANNLSRVLQVPKSKHMPCVPVDDAKELFQKIQTIEEPLNRLGLLLIAVTFVRYGEMRNMKRGEIVDKRFWVVPESRMKMKKPHVVPLSDFALKILAEIDVLTGEYDYYFQSPVRPNKPISENALLDALYGIGYRHKMTVHGFRALASTVLNEQSPFHHDVIERQLAHKETDAVRAAYNRAEYLEERIKLMDWWSNWIQSQLN